MQRPRNFGEPVWATADTVYLSVGTIDLGATGDCPAPVIWVHDRDAPGGWRAQPIPPRQSPRPLGFRPHPKEHAS